ncbi:MAG: hypothetical protein JWO30_801 [Fibrobacteres bacterium]|nr:hypothetical protein [Fibrobacterota bacterium]
MWLGVWLSLGFALAGCSHSAPEVRQSREPDTEATTVTSVDPSSAGNGPESSQPAWTQTDTKVRLRLHNLSDSLALTDVLVVVPGDSAHIGFIGPRAYSEYFAVDTAYRYAFIKAKSGGKEYFCQPADYTGETTLTPGRYTYELTQVRPRDKDAVLGFFLVELLEDKGHP